MLRSRQTLWARGAGPGRGGDSLCNGQEEGRRHLQHVSLVFLGTNGSLRPAVTQIVRKCIWDVLVRSESHETRMRLGQRRAARFVEGEREVGWGGGRSSSSSLAPGS